VLVQDNRAQLLVSPDLQGSTPQNSAAVNNPVQEQDLNSERELITSLYLVRLALDGLPVPRAYEHRSGMAVAAVKAAIRLPLEGYHVLHSIPRLSPRDAWAPSTWNFTPACRMTLRRRSSMSSRSAS
jgi:hypothetical protein